MSLLTDIHHSTKPKNLGHQRRDGKEGRESERGGAKKRRGRKEVKVTMGVERREEALFLQIDVNHRREAAVISSAD